MERMLPPDELERARAEVEVDVVGDGQGRRRGTGPTGRAAQLLVGRREVDDRVEPAGERLVDVGAQVGRQHRQAVEGLHPLQQVGDLDVGVAVVGVAHLAALAEHGVGLVEEEHGVDARRPR